MFVVGNKAGLFFKSLYLIQADTLVTAVDFRNTDGQNTETDLYHLGKNSKINNCSWDCCIFHSNFVWVSYRPM